MPKPTNTIITLIVETTTINQGNKKSMVNFSDNQCDTDEVPGQPGTYLSTVNKNSNVTWIGFPSSGSDIINITNVSKKSTNGGSDILKSIGPKKGSPQTVTAKVKNKDVSGNESYEVSFNINGNESYTIDPLLKMRG